MWQSRQIVHNMNVSTELKEVRRRHRGAYTRKWRLAKRQQAFEKLSGGNPRCACCGETTYEFLAIDHVNGGGKAHIQLCGGSGGLVMEVLRRKDVSMFQLLCHNCNMARSLYGNCPHERHD